MLLIKKIHQIIVNEKVCAKMLLIKKDFCKELMLVAWHWYVSKDDKKAIESLFIDEKKYKVVGIVTKTRLKKFVLKLLIIMIMH